ncbi:hypothetical protein GCM10009119_39870 [Algoriphagus jejuensis]|uniref:Uncharacterized protein n=1 Tax=Algoriphagus jejuensis TaxID=419934 RepID=A0ABP3YJY8_9BACT
MDSNDAQFISGIYNWCDRWCERCDVTARCRVFEREQERDLKSPEDFWNALAENFKETMEMLHALAKEQGMDIEKIIAESKNGTTIQEEDKIQDEHPLIVLTDCYLFDGKG